jgi:hypothetical protein
MRLERSSIESGTEMQVRFARHTERLSEVTHFYGHGLGLPQIDSFHGHDGYDGAFFELPGTDAHLEFTTGGRYNEATPPHPETLLVLYLGTTQAVDEIVKRIAADPVQPANPYWRAHAVTLADPDGYHVVLVPEAWPGT